MYLQITRCEMTQSSCKRDTKSKRHRGMKLAPVRVFSCKHPLRIFRVLVAAISGLWMPGKFNKEDVHKNAHWSELRPFLCECFLQEWRPAWWTNASKKANALLPDWRLVPVNQSIPKLPTITLEGSIMRLLISLSVLSVRKASDPTSRWRPSWLKLLMVTTMRQISSFLKHHHVQQRCWYRGTTWACH